VGATVDTDAVPLSAPARSVLDTRPGLLELLLSGGDDYELLFTTEPDNADAIENAGRECGVDVTRIGAMTGAPGITFLAADGSVMPLAQEGYVHF
jgi:thiamine-monophosphate kinase